MNSLVWTILPAPTPPTLFCCPFRKEALLWACLSFTHSQSYSKFHVIKFLFVCLIDDSKQCWKKFLCVINNVYMLYAKSFLRLIRFKSETYSVSHGCNHFYILMYNNAEKINFILQTCFIFRVCLSFCMYTYFFVWFFCYNLFCQKITEIMSLNLAI